MSAQTYESIQQRLADAGIAFETRAHAEDALPEVEFGMCKPEDVPIPEGAMAAVVKGKKTGSLYHFVIPDDQRLDQKKARQVIGERFSFASVDELVAATDCIPGSVPPFGSAIGMKTYVDKHLQDVEHLVFNCGTRTGSMRILSKDYFAFEKPEIVDCVIDKTV